MKLIVTRNGAGICNNHDLNFEGALPLVVGTEVELIEGPNIEGAYSVCKISVRLEGGTRIGWIAESSLGYPRDIVVGDDAKVRCAIDYSDLYSRDVTGVLSTASAVILSPGTRVRIVSTDEEGFLNGRRLPLYKIKVIGDEEGLARQSSPEGWIRKLHLKPMAEEYQDE